LTFSGAFFAPAGQVVDYKIQYVVTAPAGFVINDAVSSAVWNLLGGTGTGSISEILTPLNAPPGTPPVGLNIISPNVGGVPTTFPGFNSFLVQKDILLVGGTNGIGVSVVNQGFSSVPAIPEPTSMALLGIGLIGLFGSRRLFKRASAA